MALEQLTVQEIVAQAVSRDHFLPPAFAQAKGEKLEKAWGVDRFDDFLVERAEILSRVANHWLAQLREGESPKRLSSAQGGDHA